MANTDLKIQIIVGGSEDAVRKIKSVDDAIGGASGSGGLIKSFTLGNLAASAITKGVELAANAVADFGRMAVNTMSEAYNLAAGMQQTAISFEVLTGNAELSRKTLKELTDFALRTPFSLGDIQDASKRLLAYGVAAEELIPTMEMLGNITAGVGTEKMPQLILAYGQVRAATRLTGMELRQFTETGVPMLAALAESMNVPISQVQKLVSEGKVSFEEVDKALKLLTSDGGKFDELMLKQSKTLGGVTQNLDDMKDRLLMVLGGYTASGEIIEGGFVDVLAKQLSGLLDWILANEPQITEFFTNLSIKMGDLINTAVDIAKRIPGEFEKFKKGIEESGVQEAIDDLAESIGLASINAKDLGINLDGIDWTYANENLGLAVGFMSEWVVTAAKVGLLLPKTLVTMGASIYWFGQKVQEANFKVLEFFASLTGGKLDSETQKAYDKLKSDMQTTEDFIVSAMEDIDMEVSEMAKDVTETITGVPQSGLESGKGLMTQFIDAIKNGKPDVETELNGLQSLATTKGTNTAESYASNFQSAMKKDGWKIWTSVNSVLSNVPKGYYVQSTASGPKVSAYYATGGVIPGTSYTGDKVIIGANSGEMMLNREQQSNLFNFLKNLSAAPRNINFGNVTFGGGERSPLQEQNMFMNLLVNAV